MLWLKAFHIIFVISWFAGVFYLPRLFVNHVMTADRQVKAQLLQMQEKLFRFMTILAVLAIGFGVAMLVIEPTYFFSQRWMQLKLVCVLLLVAFHIRCGFYLRAFREERVTQSERYFRLFNELPVLLMFAIVILAVVKPFAG